jgi:hypothetical protein
MKRRYEATLSVSAPTGETPQRETKYTKLEREYEKLATDYEALKQRSDGSLFDLKKDKPADIARIVGATVPLGRFQSIQKAFTEELNRLKAQTAHAG